MAQLFLRVIKNTLLTGLLCPRVEVEHRRGQEVRRPGLGSEIWRWIPQNYWLENGWGPGGPLVEADLRRKALILEIQRILIDTIYFTNDSFS